MLMAFSFTLPSSMPPFLVSSLKISNFKITTVADDITVLTTKLNVTLSTKNLNIILIYNYKTIIITTLSNQIVIANESFLEFTSSLNDVSMIHSPLSKVSQLLDADSVSALRKARFVDNSDGYKGCGVDRLRIKIVEFRVIDRLQGEKLQLWHQQIMPSARLI
ncbi:uncharacterized protein LOC132069276 [Lycium ferocissimum]|uniref:uncharacterized protein LOC132069276 n=1 Tax=Lycium ferocissimum TaxID=112874 RepID=UPI0028152D32|nr:uncharacterized protein LOC132069276 [Lycium ferocissimum]